MRKIQFALGAGGGFTYPDDASLFTEVDIDVPNMLVHATYAGSLPLAASARHSTVFKEESTLGLTDVVIDSEGGTVSTETITTIVEQVIADSGFVEPIAPYEQIVTFPAGGGSMTITHNRNATMTGYTLYGTDKKEYSASVTEVGLNSFILTTSTAFTGKIVCSFV